MRLKGLSPQRNEDCEVCDHKNGELKVVIRGGTYGG